MNDRASVIGRVGTALVFGACEQAKGVVTFLTARLREDDLSERLKFTGPCIFTLQEAGKIQDVALPLADRISGRLGQAPQRFELSIVNVGAASAMDVGLQVSGGSAGAAVALALLSATLKIPLAQDTVVTGNLASPDGDIRAVRSLPAKLAAAIQTPGIKRFICPALDDASLKVLSHQEKQKAEEAVIAAREKVRVFAIHDICDLLGAVMDEEAVVLGALEAGFFEAKLPDSDDSAIERAARFLVEDNTARFWRVLEGHMIVGRTDETRRLLRARCEYHIGRKQYPAGFGRQLHGLVESLPPATRRLKTKFPLISQALCIQLTRQAGEADCEDVRFLLESAAGKIPPLDPKTEAPAAAPEAPSRDATAAVDAVISEISANALTRRVTRPIDSARATFILDSVVAKSYDEFLDTIRAFHNHLMRHAESAAVPADEDATSADSVNLLERAFANKGGLEAARAESLDGLRGGLRYVLDVMTEHYKAEQQRKRINGVLRTALDPKDHNARVAFMAALMARIGPQLSAEIRSQPPAYYARHLEEIAQAYVESLDRVSQAFRNL